MTSGQRSLRVLVADDDPLNLRIAARLLRELGHTGSLVTDGHKALTLLAQQRSDQGFDLMLLDISMPQLDGLETLKLLRSTPPAGPRLRVLMVSGHDDASTRDHFLAAGADGFLCKPLSIDALRLEIQRICGA